MPKPVWSVVRTVQASQDEVRAMHARTQPLSPDTLRHLHRLAALPVPDDAALERLAHELEPLVALIRSVRGAADRVPRARDEPLFVTTPAPDAAAPEPGTAPLARDALLARTPRHRGGFLLAP